MLYRADATAAMEHVDKRYAPGEDRFLGREMTGEVKRRAP